MSRRILLTLSLLGLGAAWLVSRPQAFPGYMDADYYYIGGLRLAQGAGFSEQVIWNYLDFPSQLPHPSHGYWGPLVSLIAAAGMRLSGRLDFDGARLPFLLLAAALPALTAGLSFALHGRKSLALLSGFFAIFSGFYLPYLTTTDSFGPTMIAGALYFLLLVFLSGSPQRAGSDAPPSPLAIRSLETLAPAGLGALAGGMHLARADGAVWLLAALAFIWVVRKRRLQEMIACLAGYLLVFGPWMARNLGVFGAPLPPGSSRALWINAYDELYVYPGSLLTPARWLQFGVGAILQARWVALLNNLQSALAVQGQIFLAPLALIGFWRLRRSRAIQAGALLWTITLLVMTLVFPFQGWRGGFFHSGAALQPLIWAVSPLGFDALLDWAARKRGWNLPQARRFFSVGLIILAALLTAALSFQRIFGSEKGSIFWNQPALRYLSVEARLQQAQAAPQAVVMVNNPPGYYAVAQRPAVVIPYGDLDTLLAAARHYHAEYLIVELDQVQGEDLFAHPGDRPGLRYLGAAAETRIYAIISP